MRETSIEEKPSSRWTPPPNPVRRHNAHQPGAFTRCGIRSKHRRILDGTRGLDDCPFEDLAPSQQDPAASSDLTSHLLATTHIIVAADDAADQLPLRNHAFAIPIV
jgi:hypothetical protein